jgi:hypothetical protein
MKQLLQNLRTGETEVVEVPIPTPQSGEVLVKTRGIFGIGRYRTDAGGFCREESARQGPFSTGPGTPGSRQSSTRGLADHHRRSLKPPGPAYAVRIFVCGHGCGSRKWRSGDSCFSTGSMRRGQLCSSCRICLYPKKPGHAPPRSGRL